MDLQFHRCRPFNVMVVDNDMAHHIALEKILNSFGTPYQMFKYISPSKALDALKIQFNNFDIVLSGIPLSNVHGFSLVRCAGHELNIVVIYMISNYTEDAAFQGVLIGASKCVPKPITNPQILKDVWQHVIHKRREENTLNFMNSMARNSSEIQQRSIGAASDGGVGPSCSYNPRGVTIVEEGGGIISDQDVPKRQRFVWTKEYQQLFLEALDSIKPPDKVIPTKLLEYMKSKGVPNITRENVASHLQKHRLLIERSKGKNLIIPQYSTSLDENKEPSSVSYDQNHETLALPQQLGSGSISYNQNHETLALPQQLGSGSISYNQNHETLAPPQQLGSSSISYDQDHETLALPQQLGSSSISYDQNHETLTPPQQLGSSSSPQQIPTIQEQQHELIVPPQNQPNENGAIIPTSIDHEINQNNNNGDIIDWEAYLAKSPLILDQPQQNQISPSTLLDQIPFGNNTYYSDQGSNFNHENDHNVNNPYDFDIDMANWNKFSVSFSDQQDELKRVRM